MASHHVLLIGGHGNIAQMLTPLLLKRSWTVTSMIRTKDQAPTIEKLGAGQPGKLNVLVSSVAEVTSEGHAENILNSVKPDMVVWSAGAGGKGGAEMTMKIDGDAATHFVRAAAKIPSISRFLLVSYNGSRRNAAPWWPAGAWEKYKEAINNGPLATYSVAKLAADEAFYKAAKASPTMVGIGLRPGLLHDGPAGKVVLGKAPLEGKASRESVAQVADALLAAPGAKTAWIDMLDGDDTVQAAVDKIVSEGFDGAVGEAIYDASK